MAQFLQEQTTRQKPKPKSSLKALDQVIDMKRSGAALNSTLGLNGQVDLEHHGKGQVGT